MAVSYLALLTGCFLGDLVHWFPPSSASSRQATEQEPLGGKSDLGIQGTVKDWRRDHLERVAELQQSGFSHVEWSSAGDELVCSKCAARNGKVYTISEIRREIQGEFCCPGDPDDRCRCVIVAAEAPSRPRRQEKSGCLLVFLVQAGFAAELFSLAGSG